MYTLKVAHEPAVMTQEMVTLDEVLQLMDAVTFDLFVVEVVRN